VAFRVVVEVDEGVSADFSELVCELFQEAFRVGGPVEDGGAVKAEVKKVSGDLFRVGVSSRRVRPAEGDILFFEGLVE